MIYVFPILNVGQLIFLKNDRPYLAQMGHVALVVITNITILVPHH